MRMCSILVGLLEVYPSASQHVLLRPQTRLDPRMFDIADGGTLIQYKH